MLRALPAHEARRSGGPGAGRSLAVALAWLRPRRGDRHCDGGAGRAAARSVPAPRTRAPAGGQKALGEAHRPAPGLGRGAGSPARAPRRRRLDDRRDARGLRHRPSAGRRAEGRRSDARSRPLIRVRSPGGRDAQTGSGGCDPRRAGHRRALGDGERPSSDRPAERSRGRLQVPDRPDQRGCDAGHVRDGDGRHRRSGLSDRPGRLRGLRPSRLLRQLPGLHDG